MRYLIRVEGLLSSGPTSAFPSLHASQHAQTVLAGSVEDQASLAAVLKRLEDLGVDVTAVHRIPDRQPRVPASTVRPAANVGGG